MSSRPIRGAARLAAILDALPDALLLVNSNGTVVDANNAAVQALQAPGTSLVGMGVLDLLPEFDPSRIPGSMRPAAREDEALDRPVRMTARRTDGTTFPVEVSGNDFDDDGTGTGAGTAYAPPAPYDPYREGSRSSDLLLLLVRDLTGRLGVEAELRRQHKQTEMILRAAAEGVLGVDLEGRCVLVNPAAAHILEYRASELGGRELHPLIQHSRADGTPLALEESALLDTLTSGRKHRVRGTVLWRKDGRPVTVDLTTAPVRDGDQLVGAVMTFTDRSRELALVARNEHLTAVLESELGGALTALHRRIDALAADPAGQLWPEANWTLRRLADECRRYGKLIEGVLAHQRSEAGESGAADGKGAAADGKGGTEDGKGGRKSAERVPVALDKVVRRAVEHAGELVGAGRVRFSVHAAAVEVIADEQRLAQALAHLVADVSGIGLALDDVAPELPSPGLAAPGTPALPPAGGDTPAVVLAAAQRGEVARVEIRGPGRGGSPVHLPIARAVVERHGGVLQPHELPGRAGTTYVVELPLDPAAAKAAAERASAEGRSDRPKESDSAVLPDLPGIPQLPTAAPAEEPAAAEGTPAKAPAEAPREGAPDGSADARRAEAAAGPSPAGGAPGEEPVVEQRRGRRGRPAVELPPAAPEQPGREAAEPAAPVGAIAPDIPADQWPNAPARIERAVPEQWNGTGNDPAYGRQSLGGPSRPQNDPWGKDDGRSGTAYAVPVDGGRPDGRPGDPNGAVPGDGERRAAGGEGAARTPIALGPGGGDSAPKAPAGHDGGDAEPRPSRRRRALPGAEDSSGGFALPGGTETPVYPGLEHALPAGPAPAPPEPAAPTPTGRRRRLAVPPGPGGEAGPAAPEAGPAGGSALPALPPAVPALPAAPGDEQREGGPRPVGTGLGELAPPRPFGAPGAPGPAAVVPVTPVAPAAEARPRAALELPAAPAAPAVPTAPQAVAPVALPSGRDAVGEHPQLPAPAPDGGPRRLLVWPEPDPATRQALQDRGYRPVIVRSREEVDAQVAGFPAALFVDPLTGPITRTALQSLRTAALNSRVPVLVTAGLGQATRDAAYGADPAVLLRALAPRDGENHAPRVLLVEGDPDIAAAMIGSLERRGMHVEHAVDENDAVARASSVQPNLVVMDLLQIRRRRVGLLDWLRANDRLHRTPLVVYTSVDLDPRELPRLRTGETVLFLAERSTSDDVQSRIVDLLGRIGAMGEAGVAAAG
ncbi:PAS domain-containing protein [Kitasatospora sp. NPDC004723]|uniref:PAS domain-containing protein n=1 Tax=Kitasatospora sp. NPDC004723 TaxID=3154288 RepID=UPI0033B979E1